MISATQPQGTRAGWLLFSPASRLVTARARYFDKAALYFSKQSRWQRAVIAVFTLKRAQIGSGPGKPVALAHDDPRSIFIQSQPLFHGRRNFNSVFGALGRRMRDGQNTHDGRAVLRCGYQRQHQTRPVFVTLFPAFQMLPVPQVSIAQNIAHLNVSRQHIISRPKLLRVRR